MKWNYILIPLIVIAVSLIGGYFTNLGMGWYGSIRLPDWIPSGGIIGIIWTVIFILSTISVLIVWNFTQHDNLFRRIMFLFAINGLINISWSFVFFYLHKMGWAILVAALLEVSVLAIIYLIRVLGVVQKSELVKGTYMLLLPYAGWVIFATYLTYTVWSLNRI